MQHHASCDVTSFGTLENWRKFKNTVGLKGLARRDEKGCFVWVGNGISVTTGNNPETGEYRNALAMRPPEVGFASYIGATGSRMQIAVFKAALLKFATFRKSDIVDKRSYI